MWICLSKNHESWVLFVLQFYLILKLSCFLKNQFNIWSIWFDIQTHITQDGEIIQIFPTKITAQLAIKSLCFQQGTIVAPKSPM